MNIARLVVLAIALSAGGVAAYLASSTGTKTDASVAQVEQMPTVDVLIAKSDIPLGQKLTANNMIWQTWPSATTSGSFIRRSNRADASTQLTGWIARAPFVAGEPIREAKLVKADGSGFMAAILPSGSRAISTEISAETGAGGFILPNDRVDVILTRRLKDPSNPDEPDTVRAEVILSNVRVLAIDQAPKEKEGTNNVVGRTVTLELKPGQTATLASSRQAGTLSLSLRSIADANQVEMSANNNEQNRRVGINVVRYGVTNPNTMAK